MRKNIIIFICLTILSIKAKIYAEEIPYIFDSKQFSEQCRQWHSKKSQHKIHNVEFSAEEKLLIKNHIRLQHAHRKMLYKKCKKIQQMTSSLEYSDADLQELKNKCNRTFLKAKVSN